RGVGVGKDRRFVAELARRHRPGRALTIFLQFDGFDERTHRRIRGRDLRDIKRRALESCAEAGLIVTLVAAIERGVNEHEIGSIVKFGVGHPAVRGVTLQPVTHSGRHLEFDPLDRLTNPDVIRLLDQQVPEWFQPGDFFPVPCCFPTCRSVPYLMVDEEAAGQSQVVPITRLVRIEDYLDYVSNRIVPDFAVQAALEKLWSASAVAGSATTQENLATAMDAANCGVPCGIDLPRAVKTLTDRAVMIVVQDFQDAYTLNVRQLMKCCVAELTPDGRMIPICAYNSVGYREAVRARMSGVSVARTVPNATSLRDLLIDSPYGSKIVAELPEG